MTSGIQGTGPYSKIRSLRRDISDCKYELGLVSEGMKRPLSKKTLERTIAEKRAIIKEINNELKVQGK